MVRLNHCKNPSNGSLRKCDGRSRTLWQISALANKDNYLRNISTLIFTITILKGISECAHPKRICGENETFRQEPRTTQPEYAILRTYITQELRRSTRSPLPMRKYCLLGKLMTILLKRRWIFSIMLGIDDNIYTKAVNNYPAMST